MAPKTLKAKYASVCPKCDNKINVDDEVTWVKGEKATHPEGKCPAKIEKKEKGAFGRPTPEESLADEFARIMVRETTIKYGLSQNPEKDAAAIYRMVRALMEERKKK